MSNLQAAVASVTELFTDTQFVSHPYTEAHMQELRRRAVRIGAGLTNQEHRNKFNAILEVGMRAVSRVQVRNSQDVDHDGYVGVAGVQPEAPRWEEKLESLEYSLAGFGLNSRRLGDDCVVVSPKIEAYTQASEVPFHVVASKLPARTIVQLLGSDKRKALAACADTYLYDRIQANESVAFDQDEMLLFLDCLAEHESCASIHQEILASVGIVFSSTETA